MTVGAARSIFVSRFTAKSSAWRGKSTVSCGGGTRASRASHWRRMLMPHWTPNRSPWARTATVVPLVLEVDWGSDRLRWTEVPSPRTGSAPSLQSDRCFSVKAVDPSCCGQRCMRSPYCTCPSTRIESKAWWPSSRVPVATLPRSVRSCKSRP